MEIDIKEAENWWKRLSDEKKRELYFFNKE